MEGAVDLRNLGDRLRQEVATNNQEAAVQIALLLLDQGLTGPYASKLTSRERQLAWLVLATWAPAGGVRLQVPMSTGNDD